MKKFLTLLFCVAFLFGFAACGKKEEEKRNDGGSINENNKGKDNTPENKEPAEQPEEKDEYTVSFSTDGGSNIATQTIEKGNKAIKPKDPTKKDYVFVEWELDGKKYDFNSVVSKDMVLKAIWKKNENPNPETKVWGVNIYSLDFCGDKLNFKLLKNLKIDDGKTISESSIKLEEKWISESPIGGWILTREAIELFKSHIGKEPFIVDVILADALKTRIYNDTTKITAETNILVGFGCGN